MSGSTAELSVVKLGWAESGALTWSGVEWIGVELGAVEWSGRGNTEEGKADNNDYT